MGGGTPSFCDSVSVAVRKYTEVGLPGETSQESTDTVLREIDLTVVWGDLHILVPSCSPSSPDCLAVGRLVAEGVLSPTGGMVGVEYQKDKGIVRVWPRTSPQPKPPPRPLFSPRPSAIVDAVGELLVCSPLFKATGASHAAALCDSSGIVLWHEDVGRHNAVDKVVGAAFLGGVPLGDKILALTGRINSEIAKKAQRADIPVVASKAAPTDLGIKVARESGITVVGFVRGGKMTVYSCPERLAT